jgi:hypothetical protein
MNEVTWNSWSIESGLGVIHERVNNEMEDKPHLDHIKMRDELSIKTDVPGSASKYVQFRISRITHYIKGTGTILKNYKNHRR